MQIGELSKHTGVSVRSLRFYENKKLIKANRLENSYREFDESAVTDVRMIQLYFGLGFNTDHIEHIFSCKENETDPPEDVICDELMHGYEEKLDQIKTQIKMLNEVRAKLEDKITVMKHKKSLHTAQEGKEPNASHSMD